MSKRQIGVSVSDVTYAKLQDYAKQKEMSISALVRYIINVWMTAKKL